jgi:hypothetical protein
MLVHKIVRNDDHCPVCRRFDVSFHQTIYQAHSVAYKTMRGDKDEHFETLKNTGTVWIDEWVRRSNGDRYTVFKPTHGTVYHMRDFTMDRRAIPMPLVACMPDAIPLVADLSGMPLDMVAMPHDHNRIGYLVLRVKIRKSNGCPYNLLYTISIHSTLESAHISAISLIDRHRCYGHVVTEKQTKQLAGLNPVWVEHPHNPTDGDMYRIIGLKHDKCVNLNKYCAQAQPDAWNRHGTE